MSGEKRYYWLKLNENFFEEDTIQWIEEQENGKDYIIFYLKLALKSLKDDGKLIRYVGETLMPYDTKALSKLTSTNIDTVNTAMTAFQEIGLIERLETGEIYMKQINEMTGSETKAAERMRRMRARENKEKLIGNNDDRNNVQESYSDVQKSDTEIELDKEIEKEKESTSRKYSFDDTQFSLAELLWGKVKVNFPNTKKPNLESWANDIRLMMEQDHRTEAEIKGVINWSQKHDFWYANIRSASKLRKQYDEMYAQADRERRQEQPKEAKKYDNSWKDIINDFDKE